MISVFRLILHSCLLPDILTIPHVHYEQVSLIYITVYSGSTYLFVTWYGHTAAAFPYLLRYSCLIHLTYMSLVLHTRLLTRVQSHLERVTMVMQVSSSGVTEWLLAWSLSHPRHSPITVLSPTSTTTITITHHQSFSYTILYTSLHLLRSRLESFTMNTSPIPTTTITLPVASFN